LLLAAPRPLAFQPLSRAHRGAARGDEFSSDLTSLEKGWSWLGECVDLKSTFFGFSANLNKIVADLLAIRTTSQREKGLTNL